MISCLLKNQEAVKATLCKQNYNGVGQTTEACDHPQTMQGCVPAGESHHRGQRGRNPRGPSENTSWTVGVRQDVQKKVGPATKGRPIQGRKDVWFHLNHCCRANNPERPIPWPRARQRAAPLEPQGEGEAAPREAEGRPEGEGDASPQEQGTRRSARLASRQDRGRVRSDSNGSLPERVSSENTSEGGSLSTVAGDEPHELSSDGRGDGDEGPSTERTERAEGAEAEGEEGE
uniref:uncharacterized protein LOC117262122 n=1 Tax=Epinephelus lanceolatus TaxID=310571 RepID=UPI0014475E58|nr:uncharacterized protein LOC117262122 [Epinephelus lanceolatus]